VNPARRTKEIGMLQTAEAGLLRIALSKDYRGVNP